MFKYTWRNWTQEFVQRFKKFDSTLSNVLAITIFFQLVTPLKHSSSYQGEKITSSLQIRRFELSRVWVTKGKIEVKVWRKSMGLYFGSSNTRFNLAKVRVIGSWL